MRDRQREQRDACGVGTQRPRAHPGSVKAVRREESELEGVPSAFRADREQDPLPIARSNDVGERRRRRRIRHDAKNGCRQPIQIVLDQDLEPSMD